MENFYFDQKAVNHGPADDGCSSEVIEKCTKIGYDPLLEASKKEIKKINAYFLAPEYHRKIQDKKDTIVKLLNHKHEETLMDYKFLEYESREIEWMVLKTTRKKS